MIGIVESGSTKTRWHFINKGSGRFSYQTLGFNPFYQESGEISRTIREDLLPAIEFSDKIYRIFYYGASCEAECNRRKVAEAFHASMPGTEVVVMHDLLAAAKALFGDEPGIACISGTGSNTCYYNGKDVAENIHSLGLFMGDEGSGGYKGKLLARLYIRKELPPHLMKAFEEEFADRTDEILVNIYSGKMPSRYLASFAPFLLKYINESAIFSIVRQSFEELFDNCILKYKRKDLPVGFVGSVAWHFREVLHKVAEAKGVKISNIDPDPSEALVKYHAGKEFGMV